MSADPIGLDAHEAALAREMSLLNLPPKTWLTPRAGVHDVVIVGGGVSGLCAAAALRFLGVENVTVLDRAPEGREGPWITYARMRTLRTQKEITGPALGVPALTPRAWFEAQFGAEAWAKLDRMPRPMWMDYMNWYRRVLALPVQNNADVAGVSLRDDGLIEIALRDTHELLLARRVVLATGLDGLGEPVAPRVAHTVDRRFWAHSSDDIDFAVLRGKRIGVIGAGASAMDNAATALEAGAASVDMLIRRKEMPRVDKFSGVGSRGMAHGFLGLPPDVKWDVFRMGQKAQLPAPRHSVQRVSQHPNARFHFGSPILSLQERDGALDVTTAKGVHRLDFLIFATGFSIDLAARPELATLAPHVRLWRDSFTPLTGEEDEMLAASPDLGPAFEFREKIPGACPGLNSIFAFNYAAVLSHGKLTSGIPSISDGAQRLAQGIARGLFVEDRSEFVARFANYDTPELLGDEWTDADASPQKSEFSHA
ncbi:NAD(P)/FAD-dependent oxidoreductase [Terrarubrum flagellatum]|uniref:NAD(P)/FAD-dependent oxidoreductase n=1 Tax=Terrirubrum flagellatum TaxID=2895980 RepID=UPI003144E91C